MRYLISSALVVALWASSSPLVGAAAGEESGPPATSSPGKSPPRALPEPTEAERKIASALEKEADVDWIDTQLGDVVAHLSEKYGIPIQIDVAALAGEGRGSEDLVTKKMRGVSLKQVLRATLEDHGLACVVRFDQLVVTTKAAAAQIVRTRVYPVHDLVLMPGDSSASRANTEPLVDLIFSTIAPESWREQGGTQGDIKPYDGNGVIGLVITHTEEAHEQIEQLLANLRAAQSDPIRRAQARQITADVGQAGARAPAPVEPPAPFPPAKFYPERSEAEDRLLTLLGKQADVEWIAIELADVAADLSKKYGVPIQLDLPALAAQGLGPETLITKKVQGVSLHTVLRLVLEEHGLTYIFRNDQLRITSRTAAEQIVSTRVYQVHDLAVMPDDPTAARPNTVPLMDLIVSMIAPETWREAGGSVGEIKEYVGNGVIAVVVTQNGVYHEMIESLLESVRAARAEDVRKLQAGEPGAASPKVPAPYFPEFEVDRRIAAALEKTVDVQWLDAELQNVAAEITEKYGLPLRLDLAALTADGKGGDVLITKSFRGTTLRNVLNATLEEQGLVLLAGDHPPRITTRAAAETLVRTLIYPVADLAWPPGSVTASRGDDDPLVALIHRTIDPETWRIAGGTQGEIKAYVGNGVVVLAITQVDSSHEKITALLTALRAAQSDSLRRAQAGQAPGADGAPLPRGAPPAAAQTYPEPNAAQRRIAAALAKPADIQWLDTQLGDVVHYLSEKYDLPVQLDIPALTADGKGSETLINKSVKGVSLENGLRSALDELGLTFVVAYDQVLVTTRSAAEMFDSVRVYPVHDLVVMPNDPTAARPRLESLIELIESMVIPEGWRPAGGTQGEITEYVGPGVIAVVIHQTDEGHAEVAKLLAAMRQTQSDPVREAQSRRPPDPTQVDDDDDSSVPQADPKPAEGAPAMPPEATPAAAEKPPAEKPPVEKPSASKPPEGAATPAPQPAKPE